MMSICKTLETIDFCCYRDAYSDAYTLLRKCRDDLMQYLFVLNVIQNKHGLTDEEAEKFTINSESMMKMIELDVSILVSGERKTDAELAMEKWIYNRVMARPQSAHFRKPLNKCTSRPFGEVRVSRCKRACTLSKVS